MTKDGSGLAIGGTAAGVYAPPIRRLLALRIASYGACAVLAGAGVILLAEAAGLSLAIATALAAMAAAGAAWTGQTLAARFAPALAVPADTLLQLAGTARVQARSLDEEFDALAAAALGRVRRDAQALADLARGRDDAQNANIAKSEFLANMSHQLRTPLNAIIGYATLLQEDALATARVEQVADLGRVLQASRNLLELINDMIELSKIEVGKTSFQRSIVEVRSLVASVASSFDPSEGAGSPLEVEVADGVSIMIGDGAKLRQCLLNLIGNALRHNRADGVRLTVAPAEDDGVQMIHFTVADAGCAMSPDELSALFLDKAGSADSQSSGAKLGLAITQRLAVMMGGGVSVRRAPEGGSLFTLSLPREMPRTLIAEDELPFVNRVEVAEPAGAKTALIVDDDPSAIDLTGRWLSRLGYTILSAEDGETGLRIARQEKPDLIILDILMPGMSGYQMLEAIRADAEIDAIPVVVVSVCDDRGAALRAGASDSLMKPVQPKLLEEVLDVYCRRLDGEILVIEDDHDSGALIQRAAAQVGLGSSVAPDGERGLAMARGRPPSAIVLDLGLPGMSGFEVLEELAADPKLKRIPVLIVSGREISVSEHQAIERSGGIFHAKGHTSPREIAQSLKMAVTK